MAYEFLVLFSINPGAVKDFRKALVSSGAKSDLVDSKLILLFLLTYGNLIRAWKPDTVLTRKIGLLSEGRREAVNERVRLAAQLRDELRKYFPQAIQWAGEDLWTPGTLALLETWPTLPQLQKATPEAIGDYCRRRRRMGADAVSAWIEEIRAAKVLTVDGAIVEAAVMKVKRLAKMIPALSESIREYDKSLEKCMDEHEDGDLFRSLPGAGPALAPRLLALFGSDRERYEGAEDVQNFSGISPVTRCSGKTHTVLKRHGCPKFHRQSIHEFAGQSIMLCGWARAFYDSKRAAGKGHHVALRALAYKWLRVIFHCWKHRVPYNDNLYLGTLMKHDVPWLKFYKPIVQETR